MGYKIVLNEATNKCPACDYTWSSFFGLSELSFDKDECCPCCPECGELIEDGGEE